MSKSKSNTSKIVLGAGVVVLLGAATLLFLRGRKALAATGDMRVNNPSAFATFVAGAHTIFPARTDVKQAAQDEQTIQAPAAEVQEPEESAIGNRQSEPTWAELAKIGIFK